MHPSKIKKLLILAISLFFWHLSAAETVLQNDRVKHTPQIDSLLTLIENASGNEWRDLNHELKRALYELNDLELQLEFNRRFMNEARKRNDKVAEAFAYGFKVELLYNYKEPDSVKLAAAYEALDFMRDIPEADPVYFYTASIIGDIYVLAGDYEQALRVSEIFLNEAKERNSTSGVAASLICMGRAYECLRIYDKAEASFREAIEVANENSDAALIAESYDFLIEMLNNMERYQEAVEVCRELESFALRRQANPNVVPGEMNTARFRNCLALAGAYINLGEFSLAEECIAQAETFSVAKTNVGRFSVDIIRCGLLIEQEKYAAAENLLDIIDEYYGNRQSYVTRMDMMEFRAELYERWGRYDKATDYYKEFIIMKDSIQRVEMASSLNSIRTRYEVDKLEMQHEIQEQKIMRQKNTITFIMIIMVILIAALAVITQLYRKKKSAYRSLAEKARQWAIGEVAGGDGSLYSQDVPYEDNNCVDTVTEHECRELASHLREYMVTYKPYLQYDLSLDSLAEQMNVNKNKLSRAINRTYDNNFKQYLGELRVKEAILLMDQEYYGQVSVDQLMENAGFNSRSSFYESFKKITGLTPAQYWKNRSSRSDFC